METIKYKVLNNWIMNGENQKDKEVEISKEWAEQLKSEGVSLVEVVSGSKTK